MKNRVDAELIIVGDELLNGKNQDSHLLYFGGLLKDLGFRLGAGYIIGDEVAEIADLLRRRLEQTRVIILCGGLGPTEDDITRDAVAEALERSLVFNEGAWKEIQDVALAGGWRDYSQLTQ